MKKKRKLITTLDGKSSMPPPIDFKKLLKEKKKANGEEKCWFDFCQKLFDKDVRESFYVILKGKLRRVHVRCYKKYCNENRNQYM